MVLKLSSIDDEFINRIFKECIDELEEFFGINWTKNRPSVIIFEDRKTLDEFKGSKSDNWNVGFATNNKIYLLARENFERKRVKDCFRKSRNKIVNLIYLGSLQSLLYFY